MKQVVKSAAQAHEKAKKREYVYTELAKLKVSQETVNIYGVILDASFPHKSAKSDKYICSLKIADQTSKTVDGTIETVSVVFFARKFEDLPISQRVGEIVRIHRATVGVFKDRLQLTVNICFNSSWDLFAPVKDKKTSDGKAVKQSPEDFEPIAYFGKKSHTELKDKKFVQALRTWSAKQFSSIYVLSNKYITKLSNVPEAGGVRPDGKYYDFDVQGKIIQMFKLDAYQSEIRIIDDSGEIWHADTFNAKYKHLQQGQYVRIRSATLSNHLGYEKTIGMKVYTNILILPNSCKLVNDLLFDEVSEARNFEISQLLQKETLMHPIIVSRITDSVLSKKPVVPLSEVIDNKEVYRVRFSVVASSSTEYAKCVKIQDKTGALTPATPKKGQKLVTYLQFLVKDTETLATNQLTRVNLIDNGVFFSGIQAADLQDKSKSAQLEEVVSTLERFNVWIEASVKLVNGQIVIADTTALKKFD